MEMDSLLERSRATPAFKADVRTFATSHGAAPATITAARHAPRVKVLRVVAQLLHSLPALAVERVHVDAVSGCSDFVGTLQFVADGTQHHVDFTWCCHWRAKQEGWTDAFGFPDQIRAAREFGWDCFERWEPRSTVPPLPIARSARDLAIS